MSEWVPEPWTPAPVPKPHGKYRIAVTTRGSFDAEMALSLLSLFRTDSRCFDVAAYQAYDVGVSRQHAVNAFLQEPEAGDWLLFLDDDQTFPETIAQRMSEAAHAVGADVLGVAVVTTGTAKTNFARLRPEALSGEEPADVPDLAALERERVYRCDLVGTGLCLIGRSILERVAAKFASDYPNRHFGRAAVVDMEDVDGGPVVLGEDYSFCMRVRECGGRVFAYTAGGVGHRKLVTLRPPYDAAQPERDVIRTNRALEPPSGPGGNGRNDPCHCGSGRKYKRCCLDKDEAAAREARR